MNADRPITSYLSRLDRLRLRIGEKVAPRLTTDFGLKFKVKESAARLVRPRRLCGIGRVDEELAMFRSLNTYVGGQRETIGTPAERPIKIRVDHVGQGTVEIDGRDVSHYFHGVEMDVSVGNLSQYLLRIHGHRVDFATIDRSKDGES